MRPFFPVAVSMVLALFAGVVQSAGAEDEVHGQIVDDLHAKHSHSDAMHFLHPLVTESPLPENEARLGFSYSNLPGDEGHEFAITGAFEWAPVRWFSLEVTAPLVFLDPDDDASQNRLGDVGIGFKFATFAFEEHGVLLSAGLEIGIPTGNNEKGIGTDNVIELEPWVGMGLKFDRFEWLTRVGVGIPTNQNGDREADAELEWATSLLYHIAEDKLAVLVELDGVSVFGEEEDGYNSLSITPGVRVFPFGNPDVSLGTGIRLPLTDDRDSHMQGIFTVFFHF
jgi:hypothetical protein